MSELDDKEFLLNCPERDTFKFEVTRTLPCDCDDDCDKCEGGKREVTKEYVAREPSFARISEMQEKATQHADKKFWHLALIECMRTPDGEKVFSRAELSAIKDLGVNSWINDAIDKCLQACGMHVTEAEVEDVKKN